MSYEHLTFVVRDRVATLTVNRPDKLNALNAATIDELDRAITEARERADVSGVIVTGAGRAFVAGADISELVGLHRRDAQQFAIRGQQVFDKFEHCPRPVIAAINGFALGGGCELAMACHIRIASDAATFGQPEVKLGLVPGYGGTGRLARLVGRGRALELLLTGDMIDAQEAHRIGLVNRFVPGEQLLATTESMMARILANGPLAVARCIELVVGHSQRSADMEQRAREADAFGQLAETQDAAEGVRAFIEKRRPRFGGR